MHSFLQTQKFTYKNYVMDLNFNYELTSIT